MVSATRVFLTLTATAATVGSMLLIYYLLFPRFDKNLDAPKYLDVTIHLQNECSVIDDAFIAEVTTQRRTSKFYDGVAMMRLPDTAKVKLSVSPAFPDFEYDGIPERVVPDMVLVADCSVSPRLKSIFGAMNDRFGS